MSSTKETILSTLKTHYVGAENAIQGHLLSTLCCTDIKDVRKNIDILRADGHPVCNCRQGFFYAACPGEIDSTIQYLANRIESVAKAQQGLCHARAALFGSHEKKARHT